MTGSTPRGQTRAGTALAVSTRRWAWALRLARPSMIVLILLIIRSGFCERLVEASGTGWWSDSPVCSLNDGWTRLVPSGGGGQWQQADSLSPKLWAMAAGWDAPGVLYVGGRYGLYRSFDCGTSWEVVWPRGGPSDGRPGLGLVSIHASAAAPGGRLYVGLSIPTHGVFVSDDFGAGWIEGPPLPAPTSLEAAPSDRDVAYVLGEHLLTQLTTDGGKTWIFLNTYLPAGSAVIDPTDSSIVYVVGYGIVVRSTDGARSFNTYSVYDAGAAEMGSGSAGEAAGYRARGAAISIDGSRMWLVTSSGSFYRGLGRAMSWERLPDVPFGQTTRRLSPSPFDPRVLFVLTSTDEIWAYREPDNVPTPGP